MRTRGGRAVLPTSWIIVAFLILAIVSGLRASPAITPLASFCTGREDAKGAMKIAECKLQRIYH
jgi:hypothetical protein